MGISINGKSFFGSNISISGNKIIIDGKNVTPNEKVINIVVNGNIDNLEVDACDKLEIHGDVNKLRNGSGDVECGDIKGDVTSGSGNIICKGNVAGKLQTGSGDVECGEVKGDATTSSGNITCKGSIFGNVKTSSGNVKYTKVDSLMKDE